MHLDLPALEPCLMSESKDHNQGLNRHAYTDRSPQKLPVAVEFDVGIATEGEKLPGIDPERVLGMGCIQ